MSLKSAKMQLCFGIPKPFSVFIIFNFITTSSESNSLPSGKEALYYGYLFSESTSLAIKNITDNYFQAALKFPQISSFLDSAMKNSSLPTNSLYFVKPLDPNNQTFDPNYHITTKFCGDADCSRYKANVGPHLNQNFTMHLIGYYFTNRTFGVRIALTPEQDQLFDNEDGKSFKYTIPSASQASEITFEDIPLDFNPTRAIPHITLGCAPNISAVTTGSDLLEIIAYERNPPIHKVEVFALNVSYNGLLNLPVHNATIVHYFGGAGDAFVFYPSLKVLAPATFKSYLHSPPDPSTSTKHFISILVFSTSLLSYPSYLS